MDAVNPADAKARLSELVGRVEAGESIDITLDRRARRCPRLACRRCWLREGAPHTQDRVQRLSMA